MRALAVAGGPLLYPNVSLFVGAGVHFEAVLDTAAVANTWPLRVPTMTVNSSRAGFADPDLLPIDVAVGGEGSSTGQDVTWSIRAAAITTTAAPQGWFLVSLLGESHIPRGSRIALTNTAGSVERCVISGTSFAFVTALVYAPAVNSLTLLGSTTLRIHRSSIALQDTRVDAVTLQSSLILLAPANQFLLYGAQVTISDSSVTATNCSSKNIRLSFLYLYSDCSLRIDGGSQLTVVSSTVAAFGCSATLILELSMFDLSTTSLLSIRHASQLAVVNGSVNAVGSTGVVSLLLSLLHAATDCPITIQEGSAVVINGSAVAAVACQHTTSTGMYLALLLATSSSPITVDGASTVAVASSAVRADNSSTSANAFLALLFTQSSSPLTLRDAARWTVEGFTVSANGSKCNNLNMAVLYLYSSCALALANTARLALGGVVAAAANAPSGNTLQLTLIFTSGFSTITLFDAAAVELQNNSVTADGISPSNMYLSHMNTASSPMELRGASRLVVAGGTVRATGVVRSSTSVYLAILYRSGNNPITLSDAAQMTVNRSTVAAADCQASRVNLYLFYLNSNSAVTLRAASRLTVGGNALAAANCTSSNPPEMTLFYGFLSPLTLHDASSVAIDANRMEAVAVRSTSGSVSLSLLRFTFNSPVALNNASTLALTDSAITAVNASSAIGTVLVGGVVLSGVECLLAGEGLLRLEGLALLADGTAARRFSATPALQVSVFVSIGGTGTARMADRSRLLIVRSTAAAAGPVITDGSGGSAPAVLTSIFSVPTTTFRGNSTVRVCASTASVTDATVNGTRYATASGAVATGLVTTGAAFGAVTPLDGCDSASAAGAAGPCGLFVAMAMRFCFGPPSQTQSPSGFTTTITESVLETLSRSSAPTATATPTMSPTATASRVLTASPDNTPPTPTAAPSQSPSRSATPTPTLTAGRTDDTHVPTATVNMNHTATSRLEHSPSASIAPNLQPILPPPHAPPLVPVNVDVAAVAVAGTMAAAVAADLQAQSALVVSRCAAEAAGGATSAPDRSFRALSPFATSDTCEGLLYGHAILFGAAVVVTAVTVVIVVAWRRAHQQPNRPIHVVLSMARCPSLLLAVGVFMLTGLVGGRGSGATRGVALTIAALIAATGPILTVLLGTRRYVQYQAPPIPEAYRNSAVARAAAAFLLPQGELQAPQLVLRDTLVEEGGSRRHVPAQWSKLLASVVGAWRLPYPVLALVPQLSALALVPAMLATGSLCAPLHWVSACLFWLCAVGIAVLRPRRALVADVLHCAALTVNEALVASAAVGTRSGPTTDGLGILQTALMVLRVVHALALVLLPRLSTLWRYSFNTMSRADNDCGGWVYVAWTHRRYVTPWAAFGNAVVSGSEALTTLLLVPDAAPPSLTDAASSAGTAANAPVQEHVKSTSACPTLPHRSSTGSDIDIAIIRDLRANSNDESGSDGDSRLSLSWSSSSESALHTPSSESAPRAAPQVTGRPHRVSVYSGRDEHQSQLDVVATLGVNDPNLLHNISLERADREARVRHHARPARHSSDDIL